MKIWTLVFSNFFKETRRWIHLTTFFFCSPKFFAKDWDIWINIDFYCCFIFPKIFLGWQQVSSQKGAMKYCLRGVISPWAGSVYTSIYWHNQNSILPSYSAVNKFLKLWELYDRLRLAQDCWGTTLVSSSQITGHDFRQILLIPGSTSL